MLQSLQVLFIPSKPRIFLWCVLYSVALLSINEIKISTLKKVLHHKKILFVCTPGSF